jgi:DNA-directed RNA polymerase specialized sigma24 family protein
VSHPEDADGVTASDDFASFARRMAEHPETLSDRDFGEANRQVRRYVRGRFRDLTVQEVEDVASEVMIRFLRVMADGRLDAARQPAGYLWAVCRSVALDHLRVLTRNRREVLSAPALLPELAGDDDIALAIDRAATADLVRSALAVARSKGDTTAFQVATCLLDEAARSGRRPSNRAIAGKLGTISHTGVADALRRFGVYLQHEARG